jgi:hypothetical protein
LANCKGKFDDDEDLNISMFFVSSIANTSYVLFMTLGPPDPALLAWIVTSVVTVILDVFIMCQVGMIRMRRAQTRAPTLSAKQPLPIHVPLDDASAASPLDDTTARLNTHVHHSVSETLASNVRSDHTSVVVLRSSDITAEPASLRDPAEVHPRNVHQMPIWR